MEFFLEIVQFLFFSGLIVLISKNILVKTLRELAENLKLSPKTVGNIAGVATSVPELLTISISSYNGLFSTTIYNVLSSNIINLIQYMTAIILNKNQKVLKNKAIKLDLMLVLITIILPVLFTIIGTKLNIAMVPIFVLLYFGFKKINNNVHKLYLKEDNAVREKQKVKVKNSKYKIVKNVVILIITGIILFLIGNLLGNTLENLCNRFNVPEFVIGVILGFTSSLPELITFFESQRHHKNAENTINGVVEATNNLLMSNIVNLFVILSIGIIIYTFI